MSDEGYEQQFVKEAFDTNWISPLGPNVTNFENEVANKVKIGFAVALISGTAAIHMALKAVGVGEGDIVICQSLTFSATANPIIYEKAVPVFVDSDYETWNMNSNYLELALQKYPKAKAVVVVHLYGLSANMDEIIRICKKYNVALIEDAAESLGSKYRGRQTGTFGDFGVFSFNGNKIITTSGGGMLVSNNQERIEKVRFWSAQSRDKERHYQHSELGYNYRMSNVSAGIGRGQLKILEVRVTKKREIFEYYKTSFSHTDEIEFMPINKWDEPNCWLSAILINGKYKPIDIILELEKENIESRPLWKPMHLQPFFKKFDFIGNKTSDSLYERGLCLPSDTKMTKDQQQKVIDVILRMFSNEK